MIKTLGNHGWLWPLSIGIVALVAVLGMPELAEAGRLDRIAGGISDSYETKRQAKMVSLYGGVFFVAAGIGLLVGRNKLQLSVLTPILLSLFGAALLAFHYS